MADPKTDFRFENHGTISLVHSLTEDGYEHLRDNVQETAQWWGGALAVEHRYASGLAWALRNNGYTVGGDA